MLTKKESTFLLWFLPLWIVLCVVVTVWITINNERARDELREATAQAKEAVLKNIKAEKPLYVTRPPFGTYIEITDGCGPAITSTCTLVYTTPSEDAPFVHQLRVGVVLKVSEAITNDEGVWYKVTFDEWLRYPERVSTSWYVKDTDTIRVFITDGTTELVEGESIQTKKNIIVDRSDQMLYAYDGDVLFMEQSISTGILATPTPRGTFTVYRKTPSRYMQGPIPGISTKYYDMPGVPWNLYFTKEGGVVHGAYWHDQFGTPWSNGCVNMPRGQAEKLYHWADIGMTILVRD
jgi:lipoprotein-anchoring transpeptidase ErfK/SrfK